MALGKADGEYKMADSLYVCMHKAKRESSGQLLGKLIRPKQAVQIKFII